MKTEAVITIKSEDKPDLTCGVYAPAPINLRKAVAQFHFEHAPITNKEKEKAPYLQIKMVCGQEVVYMNAKVLPNVDVPCTCGDPKHFFIKYGDEYLELLKPKEVVAESD